MKREGSVPVFDKRMYMCFNKVFSISKNRQNYYSISLDALQYFFNNILTFLRFFLLLFFVMTGIFINSISFRRKVCYNKHNNVAKKYLTELLHYMKRRDMR